MFSISYKYRRMFTNYVTHENACRVENYKIYMKTAHIAV